MQRLASIPADRFEMEDGAHLVVPRKTADAEELGQCLRNGDVVFALSRKPEKLVGVLRPVADKEIEEDILRNAAAVIAYQLRRKRLVFDDKHEKSYTISFRVVPSSFRVAMTVKPAGKRYTEKRSLRPAAKRGVAQALIEEINRDIWGGKLRDALEKAEEVHSLQTKYRKIVAHGVLEGFLTLEREISEDERFRIPRLLAANRCFSAVSSVLRPYLEPAALPSAGSCAAVVSILGDYGEGKDVVADILAASGYCINDLGANVPAAEVLEKVAADTPRILVVAGFVPISLRLVREPVPRMETCKKAVAELMAGLERRGLRERMEVILVGAAFAKRYARRVHADACCRTLWSLFQEFRKRARANRRKSPC